MGPEVEIARIPVNTRNRRKVIQTIESARSGYLSPPACVRFQSLLGLQRDEIVLIITWASASHRESARLGPHCRTFHRRISSLAVGMPELARYEPTIAEAK